ncbi:MAG: hypothetical protein IKH34_01565 [Oscillospiraceae bacterium]|nr:hypothetical protein [Oscillospiraceae bacterium]
MDSILNAPFVENEKLAACGEAAARLLPPRGEARARRALPPLRRSGRELRRCCALLRRRAEEVPELPAAWEWLLDNEYLARREALSAAGDLSGGGRVRLSAEGPLILALARALLLAGRGQVTEERAALFLEGFQRVRPLKRAELQLFPAGLRCAALGELAALAKQICRGPIGEDSPRGLEALFGTLRLFAALDPERLLTGADQCDRILSEDPAGVYPHMDAVTRQDYLRRVERLARKTGEEEQACARELIRRAGERNEHVGCLLFREPGPWRARVYISFQVLLTLSLLLAALLLGGPAAALLLPVPLAAIAKSVADLGLARLCPVRRLPRMDLRGGVPEEGRTLCVISALLTDEESVRRLCRRLEELRMACRREGKNLLFGLLADLPEAETEIAAGDEALLRTAREGVEALNGRYGGGFFLFTRPRQWDGRAWTAWERKRGALLELAKLCAGEPNSLRVTGDRTMLAGLRYLLTLDSDSRLYPGAAEKLIGAMLHPLNRPVIDEGTGVVVSGHAVLQPRLAPDLESAGETDFAVVFAGAGGSDLYSGLCGEPEQDAFGCCGFAGKGILDLRALLRCTGGNIPPGKVLSHDAVEGAFLRGGLVGEARCADRFPARPLAFYKRLHRWLRGDWQNLPFLFRRSLPGIARWRLWENLLRAMLPWATLLAVLAGFFLPGSPLSLAAWAALLALLDQMLREMLAGMLRRREGPRPRRFTRFLSGVGGAIVQTFLRLWLLPQEAWICLSAMVTALWRMAVSHRKLLQWQTAAQAERGSSGLWAHLRAFWTTEALGLACLLLSPVVLGRAAGLLWLLSPLAAFALSLPARKTGQLTREEREELLQAAGESYRYFQRFCTAEGHRLPPDNVQEQPPLGAAARSSPTNIGMAMASALAAAELELIPRAEALALLGGITDTLERLPRCRGHFFNWYDTRSLSPLLPPFISTVDSGNLCAALIAVEQGLLSWGETALASRLRALIEEMDFSFLFDRERCLFYISYDTERDRGTGGWYDLLASEAMLTSYLALARGQAPLKHWERLSRGLLQQDGYRGLASWTGTMFEYLMPALFLPYPPGSLLQESARFCLYVQKRRRFPGKPWGVSESAYYALDPGLSYRYKASGCQALALKRGQDEDLVCAPYAAFLALAVEPEEALQDLRLFRRCGAAGPWGFYEAVDFTPERCRGEEQQIVRCVMAHHAGMSVLAAANALADGLLRRLFLRDPAMAACLPLLEERLPLSAPLLRRDLSRAPEKPPRDPERRWSVQGGGGEGEAARCLLTNGVYELLLGSDGHSQARARGRILYGDPDLEGPGLEVELNWTEKRPSGSVRAERWELSESRGLWSREEGLLFRQEVCLSACAPGERRRFVFQDLEGGEGALCLGLRPILAVWTDYRAQRAYWSLGIETEREGDALLLHRLARGERRGLWLCLLANETAEVEEGEELRLRFPLALRPGERRELRLAICLGEDRETALAGAKTILAGEDRAELVGALAQRLGMDGRELGAAMALLSQLRKPLSAAAPRSALWPWGISGDEPLLVCDGRSPEALSLLQRFLLLKSCGEPGELVYLTDEEGEYRQPLRREIGRLLSLWGLEALLGARGGVHFAPLAAEETLRSRAAYCQGEPRWRFLPVREPKLSAPREKGSLPDFRFEEDGFSFAGSPLPARVWQQVLTNGHLGLIAADCGPAALWLDNARELPLSLPMEELRAAQPPELLWAETERGPVSLFAANDGHSCRVRFGPGWARWEKELDGRRVVTELGIPPWQNVRVLLIRGADGLALRWLLRPLLSPGDADSLRCGFSEGLFRAENPESGREGLQLLAGTNAPCGCRTDFTPPAMLMSLDAEELTVLCCGCCTEAELKTLLRPGAALSALAEGRAQWQRLLGTRPKSTGSAAVDRLVWPWAVYQTLACRLMGRASLYQRGGAYGFRDQLQDAVNLLKLESGYARERILDACRHQYREGDVLHWWHPSPTGDKGVRSRCSDDLLWLPWALCAYVRDTGDLGICSREEPWRSSPPLAPGERDRYEQPETAGAGNVLEHARAALACCEKRGFGPHGLPFFGSGDWNDAMDAVEGESVWLGWFLSLVAGEFAALLEKLEQPDAARFLALSEQAGRAADAAWNGRWYRRGYWSDGESLGGDGRLDLLPQAFAALSPWADPDRAEAALDEALRRLVDRERGLVKLFDPPYTEDERSPGSITGYGRGVRENGGQYTHGALFLALACFRRGRREQGRAILEMLVPENHDLRRWEAEPYALAADVSTAPGREGEAGWTWYTGSAGWFWRIATEEMEE